MTPQEIIEGLEELWELLLTERERPKQVEVRKINRLLNITNEAISLIKEKKEVMSDEEIVDTLMDTCEREINQKIGFMLTENDARIFAKALSGRIPKVEPPQPAQLTAPLPEELLEINWDNCRGDSGTFAGDTNNLARAWIPEVNKIIFTFNALICYLRQKESK